MNQDSIRNIGRKQNSRNESLFFMLIDVEGLFETLDKDFLEWCDFDNLKNMKFQ